MYVCTKECYGIHSKVSSEFIEDDVLVITTRGWDISGLKYIIHREYLNQSKTLFLCSSDINLSVTHRSSEILLLTQYNKIACLPQLLKAYDTLKADGIRINP